MRHYHEKTQVFILTSAQLEKLTHNTLSNWYVPRDTPSIERVIHWNRISGAQFIVKDTVEIDVHHDGGGQYYIVEG